VDFGETFSLSISGALLFSEAVAAAAWESFAGILLHFVGNLPRQQIRFFLRGRSAAAVNSADTLIY
jgi:hypothetical protein